MAVKIVHVLYGNICSGLEVSSLVYLAKSTLALELLELVAMFQVDPASGLFDVH